MKTKEREQAKDEEYLYLTRVANSKSTDVGMMGGGQAYTHGLMQVQLISSPKYIYMSYSQQVLEPSVNTQHSRKQQIINVM